MLLNKKLLSISLTIYEFDSDSDRKKFNEGNSNVENSDEELT